MSDEITEKVAQLHTDDDESENQGPEKKYDIVLYVKAGFDKESIGCCPFSQRLFMILWLKGVVFNVTTVHKQTMQHSDIRKTPLLEFNGERLDDTAKCAEFLEAELHPPRFPKLAAVYHQSNTIGSDIFAKFAAFIKYQGDRQSDVAIKLETKLLKVLEELDKYLLEPLDHEIDEDDDEEVKESKRPFLDGDHMTLPDCALLPKLNIIQVASKHVANFVIPDRFRGIHRYLAAANQIDEFTKTCPHDDEIKCTYGKGQPPVKK